MRTSLHILLKDLRRFWFLSALAFISVLISTLGVYWNLWHANLTSDVWQSAFSKFSRDIAQNSPPLVIFVLVIAVMQADLTVGDKAFWRTRPISRNSLLGAKLLLLFTLLIVPSVAANVFLARSVDASAPMALGIVLESTGSILVVALLAALVASVTGTMIQAVGVVLAVCLFLMIGAAGGSAAASSLHIVLPWQLNVAYPGPRIATLGIFGAAALLAAVAHQVLTLRTARTLVLYAVLVFVVVLGAGRWPIVLKSNPPKDEFPAALARSEGVQVMLKLPAQNEYSINVREPVTGRDVPARVVSIDAAMDSDPPGRIVQVQSIASKLQFEDGRELALPPIYNPFWPIWSYERQLGSICRELGLTPPTLPREKHYSRPLRLFTIPDEQARAVSGKPARLSSTVTLYEIAFHEQMRLPLRPGAASSHEGQRWEVRGVDISDAVVDVSMRQLIATTIFDPGGVSASERSDGYTRGMVLLNRKLGEYALTVDRWGSGYQPPGVLSVGDLYFRFKDRFRSDGAIVVGAIDDAWLRDAELVILVAKGVGTSKKTLVLDHFEVPQPPPADTTPAEKPFWQ